MFDINKGAVLLSQLLFRREESGSSAFAGENPIRKAAAVTACY
jgi:hypothetical protein